MTITVLFVQGAGEGTHDQWDNKLVDSLERELGRDYSVRYPRMPDEADPRYVAWKPALLDQFKSLDDGAILVGHSVGGTMLLHALAEERPTLNASAIILLATPFIGDGGWPSDEIQPRNDLAPRLPSVPIYLFHGTDDETVPFEHVKLYANAIPQAVVRTLANRDHQLGNDLSDVARDIRSLARHARPEGAADSRG
ncbi:MAG TPA: alpha/beta fold hydrolase [Kofleriaceae bacterium]